MIRNIKKYRTMSFDMSGSVMVLSSYCRKLIKENLSYFKYLFTSLLFFGLTSFSGSDKPIINYGFNGPGDSKDSISRYQLCNNSLKCPASRQWQEVERDVLSALLYKFYPKAEQPIAV